LDPVTTRFKDDDSDTKGSEVLLVRDALVGRHENSEAGRAGAPEELAVRQPRPALAADGADI